MKLSTMCIIQLALSGLTACEARMPVAEQQLEESQGIARDVVGASGASEPTSAPHFKRTYDWATSSQVIGVNPTFLENRLGPAREKSADTMTFEVDGCDVYYSIGGTEVKSFLAYIGEGCIPSLIGMEAKVSPSLTLGEAREAYDGEYHADCVEMCGNAFSPSVELLVRGRTSHRNIDVIFLSYNADLSAWADSIRQRTGAGESDDADRKLFLCVRNPAPAVVRRLDTASVEAVAAGVGLVAEALFRTCVDR